MPAAPLLPRALCGAGAVDAVDTADEIARWCVDPAVLPLLAADANSDSKSEL